MQKNEKTTETKQVIYLDNNVKIIYENSSMTKIMNGNLVIHDTKSKK